MGKKGSSTMELSGETAMRARLMAEGVGPVNSGKGDNMAREGEFPNVWYVPPTRVDFSPPKIQNRPQIFECLLQNRPYFLKFYSRTGSLFDNLVFNTRLKCQKSQLLSSFVSCSLMSSFLFCKVFQAFYNWDQFESGHMYSSLNLT